jgi:hypothetical protein
MNNAAQCAPMLCHCMKSQSAATTVAIRKMTYRLIMSWSETEVPEDMRRPKEEPLA